MIKNKLSLKELNEIANKELIVFVENGYTITELISFNNNDSFWFSIVYDKDIMIGYAILFVTDDCVEIYKISIDSSFRNKGYGSKIIDEIKEFRNKIIIEVSDKDSTNFFYKKNGFIKIYLREKYYSDNSNAIIMEWRNF